MRTSPRCPSCCAARAGDAELPRLFTALFPPEQAVDELSQALEPLRHLPLRWVASEKWHVTLCFHGAAADLKRFRGLAGLSAPQVVLAGFGSFRGGVLWTGVRGELGTLALAAGASKEWQAHLTVARGYRRQPLPEFTGSPWTPREAVLVRSDAGRYTPVEIVPLTMPNG